MRRRVAMVLLLVAILSIGGNAKARNIQPDCCALIYGTGRWLGWATSLLEYTKIRTRPSSFDRVIVECLTKVGPLVQRTNQHCSQRLEAWSNWRGKQQWINTQIRELQSRSTSTRSHNFRRNQVWMNVRDTYVSWGNELSLMYINGKTYNQLTCATCYFRLGFDTAYAAQAFRQADESFRNGNSQKGEQQLYQARIHLSRALRVFDDYRSLQRRSSSIPIRCVRLDGLNAEGRIQHIIRSQLKYGNYRWQMKDAIQISDEIGRVLQNHCLPYSKGGGSSENRSHEKPKSEKKVGPVLTGIVVNRSTIKVQIWDCGPGSGDRVDLLVNGHVIRSNIVLKKRRTTFNVHLARGVNTLTIRALNGGSSPPNTGKIDFSNVTRGKDRQRWSLNTGETGNIEIRVD